MNKIFFDRIEKGKAHVERSSYITERRSWGFTVVLDANTKINFIKGEPSVHFHRYREEDYILQTGRIEVYRGIYYERDLERTIANLKVTMMSPGDRVVIPPNIVHIPINLSSNGSSFIEVSHGPYIEGDSERIYDREGRSPRLAARWLKLGYKSGIGIKDLIHLLQVKSKNLQREKKAWVQSEEEIKIVTKPWGNGIAGIIKGVGELWLNYKRGEIVGEEEKRYVFKKLYIKEGTKTSFQYHVNKVETNHLISGKAEAWFENEKGEMEKSIFEAGDSWTIPCGRKHRTIALTNMVMLEASTPEVDDVIRIKDDTDRPSGRIESEHK